MSLGAVLPGSLGKVSEREQAAAVLPPEQLAILGSVGQELTSGATLADGFVRAMRHLDERLGARRSVLFIGDEGARTLTVEAAYGATADDFRPRYGLGVAGRVAEVGRPIVVPAVRQDPMALSELAEVGGWRSEPLSLVSVPVLLAGRSMGAFSVYFAQDASVGFATRLGLLRVVASVIAQGLRAAPPSVEDVDLR